MDKEPTVNSMNSKHSQGTLLTTGLVFATIILVMFPVVQCSFVNWDDEANFVQNYAYRGWTADHFHWMWTSFQLGVWQPLSWLLLDLEWTLWGMDPAMHHFVSLLLHGLNGILLFHLILQLLRPGKSAPTRTLLLVSGAGALFYGLHPLRVETVAWMSCQPYLLATAFALGALICHAKSVSSHPQWKMIAIVCYACSLMSKAIAIALPAAFVLLEIWPLRRLSMTSKVSHSFKTAFRLTWPYWALAVVGGLLAVVGKSHGMQTLEQHTLGHRIIQSFYALAFYVWKTIWPGNLSPLYPFPFPFVPSEPRFVLSIVMVLILTIVLWKQARRAPEAWFAWIMFTALVSPVLGIAQAGPQLAADRYTYLPGWVTGFLLSYLLLYRFNNAQRFRQAFAACILLLFLLSGASRQQIGFWKDSLTLWKRVLEVGPPSVTAMNNYGNALIEAGRNQDAVEVFDQVIEASPKHAEAFNNLGIAYSNLREWDHALQAFSGAIQIKTNYAEAHGNVGNVYSEMNRFQDAITAYRRSIELRPDNPDTLCNLGLTFFHTRQWKEAANVLEESLRLWPHHHNALYALSWLRSTAPDENIRNAQEALQLALALDHLAPDHLRTHDALAAAWANLGDFDRAQQEAGIAIEIARAQFDLPMEHEITSRLELYNKQIPYRMSDK